AASLTADAEVVLYGCSVAAGAAGRRFVRLLEEALRVPVFASPRPVGAAVLDGSWDLPGLLPGRLAFSAAARAGHPGLFAITGTGDNDTLPGTTGDDEISGLDGADFLFGFGGADTLSGGNGVDQLYGG